MKIIEEQFEQVKHCFPRQRGNVKMSNLEFLNAVLYVVENGCRWRKLPREFGNWHTVYRRMSRRSKSGVLNKVFTELQKLSVIKVKIEHVSIDSTGIKVHPDAAGALKNWGRNPSGNPEEVETPGFIRLPRMTGRPRDLCFHPAMTAMRRVEENC